MRKFTFAAIAAVAAMTMFSCGNGAPKANLKSDVDTLSYAMGMLNSQGLKDYLVRGLEMDTAYMDEFIKGLNEGINVGDDKKKVAYFAGIQIGQQISGQMVKRINADLFGNDSTKSISMNNFMSGFISATLEKEGLMTMDSAQVIYRTLTQTIKEKALEEQFGENKKAGEDFLAENAKKEGVKTLKGGVQYKVLKEGNGPVPTDTSVVKVHYEGRLLDGTVFDSSYERNQPAEFPCHAGPGGVIQGWVDALTNMPVGSTWEIYVPQELAYGAQQRSAELKPFSMLIFKIELLEVDPKQK